MNYKYWGGTYKASDWVSGDLRGAGFKEWSDNRESTFTLDTKLNQFGIYGIPARIGGVEFYQYGTIFVGGWTLAFSGPITNEFGTTELYYIYRTINSNLRNFTVTAQ